MKTFQQKSMLVRFSSGIGFSCRKKDKKVSKEVAQSKDADEASVDVFKRLLPKGALDAWQTAIETAREAHDKLTLPWRDDGYRILRSDKFMEHSDAMRKHRALVEAERDTFIAAYPGYCEKAPDRLSQMYDPKDFPPVEKLTKRFKFKIDVLPVPDGDDFRVDLADEDLAEIRQQIDLDARANTLRPLVEPVRRMIERLKDPEATFRNTLVTNITDIIKLVPDGDPAIDALITRVKELVRHDPEVLRQSPSVRQATAAKANEILATMSGYLNGDAQAAPPLELPPLEPEPLLEAVLNTISEPLSGALVSRPVVIPTPPILPSFVPVPLPASKPAAPWRRALTRCTTATLL